MPLQPIEFAIVEYASTERLEKLLSARVITLAEKKQLRELQKQQTSLNYYAIKYRYSPNSLNKSGRLVRAGNQLPKEIRKYLANNKYIDVDFANCQPNIIRQLCRKNGVENPSLEEYCNNRAEILNQFKVEKELVNICHFFDTFETPHVFYQNMHRAVFNHLIPKLQVEYEELWKHICDLRVTDPRAENNVRGSFLSIVAQTIENKCLLAMKAFFESRGREIGALIYDGLHILKTHEDEELDPAFLEACEAYIEEETGFEMRVACKPMENTPAWLSALQATIPAVVVGDDEYFEPKTAIRLWNDDGEDSFTSYMNNFFCKIVHEKTVFISTRKTRNMPWLHRKIDTVKAAYNEKIPYGTGKKPMLRGIVSVWDEMPDRNTRDNIVFDPTYIGDDPKGRNLNTFYGFAANQLSEEEIDHELIKPILAHIDLLNNQNMRESTYVKKWLASVIQRPWKKTEVSLVFNGGQGAGKGCLFDVFIGQRIIGRDKHYIYGKDIKDFTGQFNSMASGKILAVGDEVSFAGNHKDNDAMKSLITAPWQRVESKGVDAIMMHDFNNFIFLSNKDEPLNTEVGDRRYFVQRVRRIMARRYFTKLAKTLEDPCAADHFFSYLMYLDLTGFEIRDIPVSQEKEHMTERGLKPFEVFTRALLAGEVPINHATVEEIEADEGDIQMYEPGRTYTTTISHLYDRFKGHCMYLGVDMGKRNMDKKVFGSSLRNKFFVQNRTLNRRGGTPIIIRIAEQGREERHDTTDSETNSDKENTTPRQRMRHK